MIASLDHPTISGAAVTDGVDDTPLSSSSTYSVGLDHVVSNFFEIEAIEFPSGDCGDIARELYSDVAFTGMDTSNGFGTRGRDRIATMNFVTDRTARYGTLDLVRGLSLVGDGTSNSFLSVNTETIVRVPKEVRTTYFSLDLYGMSAGTFRVNRGRFSTPSVDCTFIADKGRAVCKCNAHSISGIRVAGITADRSV